jgi:hypothetical protein
MELRVMWFHESLRDAVVAGGSSLRQLKAAADQIVFGATRLVLTGFRPEKKHSIDQFH